MSKNFFYFTHDCFPGRFCFYGNSHDRSVYQQRLDDPEAAYFTPTALHYNDGKTDVSGELQRR